MNGDDTKPDGAGSRTAGTARSISWSLILTVFMPFAAGYYVSYMFRSVNAVIGPALVADLGVGAGDLGLLTAAFFLGMASFQLPLGLVLDRFGPRRVQASLLIVAGTGSLVFGIGDSVAALIVGRLLIGIGMAGSLMTGFKIIVLWFPERRWPLMNGIYMACGGLGAITATTPVEIFLHVADWRLLFVGLAAASVLLAVLTIVVVPERATLGGRETVARSLAGMGRVFCDTEFWRVAPLAGATLGCGLAWQGLWAGPWLREVVGLAAGPAAFYLLILAVALTAGFLLTGVVGDVANRRNLALTRICGAGAAVLMAGQLPLLFAGAPAWPLVLIVIGLFANTAIVVHPHLSRHFTEELSGRASAAVNFFAFVFGFAAQYATGLIVDLWDRLPNGHYPEPAYRAAFAAMLAVQAIAYLWFVLPWRPVRDHRRGAV